MKLKGLLMKNLKCPNCQRELPNETWITKRNKCVWCDILEDKK